MGACTAHDFLLVFGTLKACDCVLGAYLLCGKVGMDWVWRAMRCQQKGTKRRWVVRSGQYQHLMSNQQPRGSQ